MNSLSADIKRHDHANDRKMYWLVALALSSFGLAQYEPGKIFLDGLFEITYFMTSLESEGIEHFMFKRYEISNKLWKGMDADFADAPVRKAEVVPNWLDLF